MMNLHKRSSAEFILPILILPLLLSGFTVIGCGVPATNQNETDQSGNLGATRPNRGSSSSASESGESSKLKYNKTPLPEFVELPSFRSLGGGLELATFRLTRSQLTAGKSCKLVIVRPSGTHAEKSLPCYFLAAAGATMFTGRSLGEGDTPELRPWAEAGFVAVGYELDGELNGQTDAAFQRAMTEYEKSEAGLVNAGNAIEYVLQKLPEVDPQRLYTGGHSSAGSQSLLLAAFDQRIKAAISFNGVADKNEELRRDAGPEFNRMPPSLKRLLNKIDPGKYADQIQCPIFLFHTQEDANVSVSQSRNAYQRFKSRGLNVTLKIGNGGHYQPMIDQGIPAAIQWLTAIDSARGK